MSGSDAENDRDPGLEWKWCGASWNPHRSVFENYCTVSVKVTGVRPVTVAVMLIVPGV